MEQAVEPRHRRLLSAFDAPGRASADGVVLTLVEMGDVSAPRELAEMRAIAEELVRRGWLRRGEVADAYRRTEDGRRAVAEALDVTFYTRPGCHLCDEAKAQIAPLLARAGARLREVNIDADAELRERYNFDVPVIWLGARKVAKHRVDLEQFRRQLEDAQRSATK